LAGEVAAQEQMTLIKEKLKTAWFTLEIFDFV
jgi:hypothetical protein